MKAIFIVLYYAMALAILAIILLTFIDLVSIIAKFIGVDKILSTVIIAILLFILFSIPKFYFISKKKPSIEPGDYRIEDVKDKKESR